MLPFAWWWLALLLPARPRVIAGGNCGGRPHHRIDGQPVQPRFRSKIGLQGSLTQKTQSVLAAAADFVRDERLNGCNPVIFVRSVRAYYQPPVALGLYAAMEFRDSSSMSSLPTPR